jgi:hypothetical protein
VVSPFFVFRLVGKLDFYTNYCIILTMAKWKTNEQKLRALIKNADSTTLALVVATLTTQSDNILKDETAYREKNAKSFIHPSLMIEMAKKINVYLGSE